MGRADILEKLRRKFESVPSDEEDVVFILTRVRKVLDIHGYGLESKYGILKFYCNLALHTHIDKVPKALQEELLKAHKDRAPYHPLYGFDDLHFQLQKFIEEYKLPNFYENSDFKGGARFTELLNSIYADTPITVNMIKKYRVVIDTNGKVTGEFLEN